MATILHEPRAYQRPQTVAPSFARAGPLLVATDSTTASDSALRVAHGIARRTHRSVIVLAVQVPAPMAAPDMQVALPPTVELERRQALRLQVSGQMSRVGIAEDWPVEVITGDPAATIVNVANKNEGALVIMGLGGHGLFDRILGDETVLRVLRLGTVPVLAIAPGCDDMPSRVLAATDFTPSSVRAVALAAQVMNPDGVLTIAHVLPKEVDAANWKSTNASYEGTMGRAFDLAIAHVGCADTDIQRTVLVGDPAKAVLELAEQTNADLIVAGSHGHGFLTRLVLGSVSQKLVRGARCSVLVAPPQAGPNFLDEVPVATTRFASYEWAERLEEFTRRNATRTATLEVIDPDLGAQIEERGFPFVGASFDPRDGRVQIMLGAMELKGRHLTRCIAGVTAVQVLRDRSGRDLLLRVAHGRGQTLLTMER